MGRVATLALGALVLVFLPASAAAQVSKPSTPALIERAQERGTIGLERANLLRVYALRGDPRLPAAYESSTPWRGTMLIHELRHSVGRMDPGSERDAVVAALQAPPDPNVTNCADSLSPLPNSLETAHFYIQYNQAAIGGGLDVQDYAASLERAWATEVDSFRWAAPPASELAREEIGGKYHVRIDALAPGLYGFVTPLGTYGGDVGDNPGTSWNDQEAEATCMALNQDFATGFPGTAQQALDATTAHEFNHSIQYGYGALDGTATEPDLHMVEGAATWMEDEVHDAANDNYNYLYPDFEDSLGEHEGNEYAYWLTFRGLTERFGANVPGGAEQVMQDYWEIVSREEAVQQTALDTALANKGRTLSGAFHDYAIAAKFMLTCGAPGVRPFCFEEASGYTAAAGGRPGSHGSAGPGPHNGSLEDNHAINWIELPATGAYDVSLSNQSAGGALRATIACATGAGVAIAPFPTVATPGQPPTIVPGFDSASCGGNTPFVAITNQAQTADNPETSEARSYRVEVSAATAATSATVPPPVTDVPPSNGGTPGTGAGTGPSAGAPVVALPDVVKPTLSALSLSNRRFHAARTGRAITSAPIGVRVRYRLSEAATLTVRYERRSVGRRVGGRCRPTTRANRSRARCFRWARVAGSAQRRAQAGSSSFRLSGRWRGRALRPAVYRLRVAARDDAGNLSSPRRSRGFRIVRR